MSYLEQAKKIATYLETQDELENGTTIYFDPPIAHDFRVPYLQMSIEEIIADVVRSQQPSESMGKTVLYPGCAWDIVRCLMITGAETFVGLDIVDTLAYPGLDESVDEHTKNVTELGHLVTYMANHIQLVDGEKDEIFDFLEISGNKLVADFMLAGIPRHVVVYVGVDATIFRPAEAKDTDIVFIGSIPSAVVNNVVAHYKPKYVFALLVDPPTGGRHIREIPIRYWDSYVSPLVNDELYGIFNTTDADDPLILAKAKLLRQALDEVTVQVYEMGSVGGKRKRTRRSAGSKKKGTRRMRRGV